jgi:hypothetical protein
MKDEALKKCEKCEGELRRLVGKGAGFIFKGSGFYQTDYRSDSYQKKAKEELGGKKEDGGGKKPEGAPKKEDGAKKSADPPKKDPPASGSGGREGA